MDILTDSQKDSLRQSFEPGGFTVQFTKAGMLVSKDGFKDRLYTNEELINNFEAFKPKQTKHSS